MSNSATLWTIACQASLSSTISWSLLRFTSIESVMLSSHLIFCHSLLLLPSIFANIRVFSNELALPIRWPKYWSFSIRPSNAHSGLIFYRIDRFDLFRYHRIFRITLGSCLDISFGLFYLSIHPLIQVNWIHESKFTNNTNLLIYNRRY